MTSSNPIPRLQPVMKMDLNGHEDRDAPRAAMLIRNLGPSFLADCAGQSFLTSHRSPLSERLEQANLGVVQTEHILKTLNLEEAYLSLAEFI